MDGSPLDLDRQARRLCGALFIGRSDVVLGAGPPIAYARDPLIIPEVRAIIDGEQFVRIGYETAREENRERFGAAAGIDIEPGDLYLDLDPHGLYNEQLPPLAGTGRASLYVVSPGAVALGGTAGLVTILPRAIL